MHRHARTWKSVLTIGFALSATTAAETSADVMITNTTRFLFTTDLGNLVNSTDGVFTDTLSDAHGTASQDAFIGEESISGVMSAEINTDNPLEDKQIVSQMRVEFTVTTPQLVTLTVPTLTSDISSPGPTSFTNGAVLAIGDGLLDTSNYTHFLFDNGGDFGQLDPPLSVFDSDIAVTSFTDSFVLAPGDYALGVQQVVTAVQGLPGVGIAATEFELTFANVPEPATASLLCLGVGIAAYGARRR